MSTKSLISLNRNLPSNNDVLYEKYPQATENGGAVSLDPVGKFQTKSCFVTIMHFKKFLKANCPILLSFIRKARSKYHRLLVEKQRKYLCDLIKHYYKTSTDHEIIEILSYLETNPRIEMFPYDFTKKCKAQNIIIMRDDKSNYPYVIIGVNKVYFPKVSDLQIREAVTGALIEQHAQSPHTYLTEEFNIDNGDTVLLVGASDGIFCLSIIDKAKKIYLFEHDSQWIAPLNLTFAPLEGKGGNNTKMRFKHE